MAKKNIFRQMWDHAPRCIFLSCSNMFIAPINIVLGILILLTGNPLGLFNIGLAIINIYISNKYINQIFDAINSVPTQEKTERSIQLAQRQAIENYNDRYQIKVYARSKHN